MRQDAEPFAPLTLNPHRASHRITCARFSFALADTGACYLSSNSAQPWTAPRCAARLKRTEIARLTRTQCSKRVCRPLNTHAGPRTVRRSRVSFHEGAPSRRGTCLLAVGTFCTLDTCLVYRSSEVYFFNGADCCCLLCGLLLLPRLVRCGAVLIMLHEHDKHAVLLRTCASFCLVCAALCCVRCPPLLVRCGASGIFCSSVDWGGPVPQNGLEVYVCESFRVFF